LTKKYKTENKMNTNKRFTLLVSLLALITLAAGFLPGTASISHAASSRFFPETGHTVQGVFLDYWNTHGGLAQQGYPISDEVNEKSDTDGKFYTMQYFQRAVFEHHTEYAGTPSEVLLSLLGTFYYDEKYSGSAPGQHTSTDNPRLFNETGFTIGGAFRQYWEVHGGLAQQGYPISEEFQEVSPTDGKIYTVQYFQRAVFEYHPEYAGTPSEVLLSLLGVFYYDKRHGGGGTPPTAPTPTTTPKAPTATPTSTPMAPTATPTTAPQAPTATPTEAPKPVGTVGDVLLYNKSNGAATLAWVDSQGSFFPQSNQYDFGAGWTHVVSANSDNNIMLFYNTDTGAAMTYPLDGSAGDKKTYGFGPGWTSVIPLGGGNTGDVLFYNADKGGMMLGKVQLDGTFTYIKQNIGFGSGWSIFAGASNGPMLGYVKSNGNGVTYNVNPDGSLVQLKSYTNFSRIWTDITPANHGLLIFSRNDGGDVATGLVQYTGDFSTQHSYAFVPDPSRGWSSVAAMSNDSVMFYDTVSGVVITMSIDQTGTLNQQHVLHLDPGWTHVVGVR
jgi:hypothetical protein